MTMLDSSESDENVRGRAKEFEQSIYKKANGQKDVYYSMAYEMLGALSVSSKSNLSKDHGKGFDSSIFDDIRKKRKFENARIINPPQLKKGGMKCRKCGKTNTWFYQLQTRGADEPITTFVICSESDCRERYTLSS